jgi:hypothetical protein
MKKTFTNHLMSCIIFIAAAAFVAITAPRAEAQEDTELWLLPFMGWSTEHEGVAAWNADGTGPEPAATGHTVPIPGFGSVPYYAASRDYDDIDPDPNAAFAHLTEGPTGFPLFQEALTDNGYTFVDVQMKFGLSSLEEDILGEDWFMIGDTSTPHNLYYGATFYMVIDNEPILWGTVSFNDCYYVWDSGNWNITTSFLKPDSAWNIYTSQAFKAIGRAFLEDLGCEEIRFYAEMFSNGIFAGNGRIGSYFAVEGFIEKGLPELPYIGLAVDHQGMAGWNADGSGPEPAGDGHGAQRYYIGSRDYGNIDPDPEAAFGHFLPEMKGFLNLVLQMAYRGYDAGDVVIKQGLSSLGNDIMGLDWGFENDTDYWCNYYDLDYKLQLNDENLIKGMIDTSHSMMNADPVYWLSGATYDRPRENALLSSQDAQIIAAAFMKDLESRKLLNDVQVMTYDTATFEGNGRYDGGYFNVETARLLGVHANCGTFVQCDSLCSVFTNHTTWALAHSPYFVDNNLLIDEGHTLIIEPGVDVRIRGPYSFTVLGAIEAEGSEEQKIIFTHSNPNVKWNSIRYADLPVETDSSIYEWCVFENALASVSNPFGYNSGGAIKIKNFSNVRFSNCLFQYNLVYYSGIVPPSGGAMALWNSSPLIENCTFYNNDAEFGGALICYQGSHPLVKYSLFHGNTATASGGAIIIYEDAYPIFINNTITENYAEQYGGGVHIYDCSDDTVTFLNNIIWNNSCAFEGQQVGIDNLYNCTASFAYNDIQGGLEGMGPGGLSGIIYEDNNIDAEPGFCFPEDFIYSLTNDSPCLYSGSGDNFIGAYDWGCYRDISEQAEGSEVLTFYPNPSPSDIISVSFFMENPGQARLEIYNMTGEKTGEPVNGFYAFGGHQCTISIEGLPAGIYVGRLTAGSRSFTTKFTRIR